MADVGDLGDEGGHHGDEGARGKAKEAGEDDDGDVAAGGQPEGEDDDAREEGREDRDVEAAEAIAGPAKNDPSEYAADLSQYALYLGSVWQGGNTLPH